MEQDYELRINAALGRILRNFNFLELNLGLCLRLLENPDKPGELYDYLRNTGIAKIIKRLQRVLGECEHISDTSKYDEWMEEVDRIRLLRNFYVHATWEYLPLRHDAPLGFRVPPWKEELIDGKCQGKMTIEDLEEEANSVETVFDNFMAIRKSYGV